MDGKKSFSYNVNFRAIYTESQLQIAYYVPLGLKNRYSGVKMTV